MSEPDFYQLFDQYREPSEEAENLAWKVIHGRGDDEQNSQAAGTDEVKPLSSSEYSAFLTGLAHYLEKPEEPGRMERSLEIVQSQIKEN